ncbi:MAG: hypothetical protein NTW19_11005 [Planctomycetota bacterium]|nr:hypothetical protein [Planctomycetota bacterium]
MEEKHTWAAVAHGLLDWIDARRPSASSRHRTLHLPVSRAA